MSVASDDHLKAGYSDVEATGRKFAAQRLEPPPLSLTLGQPAPAGMFALAGTMLLMALYNLNAGGVTVPNVLVGMLTFSGGMAMTLVAMWEIARGNTLFATCFLTFSTFWLSYAAVLIPNFGVYQAFAVVPEQIPRALAIYLFVWFITSTCLIPSAFNKSILFTVVLSCGAIGVLFLALEQYTGSKGVGIAGNVVFIIMATLAYYVGVATLLASDPNGSAFSLPLF